MTTDQHGAEPVVRVVKDFEGYFEDIVRRALRGVESPYRIIHVTATPYLPDAVQFSIEGDELHLTFYSALRRGFGSVDWSRVHDLIAGRTGRSGEARR